jgi:hypothetical protein
MVSKHQSGSEDRVARSEFMEDLALFEAAQSSFEFSRVHRDELRVQYANQWLAFHKGRVVATAPSAKELAKKVERLGVSPNAVLLEFFPDKDTAIMA